MKAKISIFIPVRNGAKFIEETIRSILNQTFDQWQLIIKDNCSTDHTKEVVQKFISDPRIIWIERDRNIGAAGNFNSCLIDIPTKYYMILSHDDYLLSATALEKAYKIFEMNPDIPKVHCDMVFVDEQSKSMLTRSFKRNGRVSSDEIARKSIISVRNLYGIPLLIRASAVRNISYDSAFPCTADIDFSIAVGKGCDIFHIPEALIALRIHKNNLTHTRYDTIYQELKSCAVKNKIFISKLDKLLMFLNDYLQRLQKKIFFLYLNYIRV
jgi:glycosyltransferase involved in cell wall biosynthesis